MASKASSESRGALVVLEGLDRCGKTTQSSRIHKHLEGSGHSAELWRFPDRTTSVGQMISSYLSNHSQLDDQTIHLLFSANRWEKRFCCFYLVSWIIGYWIYNVVSVCRSLMESKLKAGTTIIVDRYSYSGVAFSSAKGLDIDWCKVVMYSIYFYIIRGLKLTSMIICRLQKLVYWLRILYFILIYHPRYFFSKRPSRWIIFGNCFRWC